MANPLPTPATLPELLDTLGPYFDQIADAVLARVLTKLQDQTWTVEPGKVLSTDGETCEVEPGSDPGAVQHATRVGGSAPIEDQTCLLLQGPKGQAWALCVIPPPA